MIYKLFVILQILHICSGVYFYIGEKEKKCFIEELPEDTMVKANYKAQLLNKETGVYENSAPGMGMHVEVKDPDNQIVLSKTYGSQGSFAFTTHKPGDQHICLHSNSTKWSFFASGKIRVDFSIQIGENTNDYSKIAAKDKLTELQLRVRQLLDQVEQIQKEQNYQRIRENRFRQTSESTNKRVLWWSVGQTLLLIIAGLWQMKHLKGFFEAKKLV